MSRQLLCLSLCTLFFSTIAQAHGCGRERWAAKVLADGASLRSSVLLTDVNHLRALPRPFNLDGLDAPRVFSERQLYEVHAELLGFKLEDDGDIHAVLAEFGNRSSTLIAEIPDPRCMDGAPASYVNAVARTRLAFIKHYGIPPFRTFKLSYQPITMVGPAFFDFEHGQSGSAPNDIEIHPVLAIGGVVPTPYSVAQQQPVQRFSSSHCHGDTLVWVNTRSGVYHFPGTRWYGATRHGTYMCRSAAEQEGYRAAHNR